jgi:hypothetical protein
MLIASNVGDSTLQEVLATDAGELLRSNTAAVASYIDSTQGLPVTGPCRLLGIALHSGEDDWATLRILDQGANDKPIMQVIAQMYSWATFLLPRGVQTTGDLASQMVGLAARAYVFWVPDNPSA